MFSLNFSRGAVHFLVTSLSDHTSRQLVFLPKVSQILTLCIKAHGAVTVIMENSLGSLAVQVAPSLQVFQCDPDGYNITQMISMGYIKEIINKLSDFRQIWVAAHYLPDNCLTTQSLHTYHTPIPYICRIECPLVRETGSRLTPYHRPRFT